jgi:hypothetical protein
MTLNFALALLLVPTRSTRQDRGARLSGAVTLVTLPHVTDAATMRKISFWRYSAVKRKTLFAALACGLLIFSMLGCNALQTTNHLQSITLGASSINGVPITTQAGFFVLQGNGGTIQLQAIGNYSSGSTKDLTSVVTYAVVVDPINNVDAFGNPLLPPCQPPLCPIPSAPPFTSGTVEFSPTGLVTAVDPATCTFIDTSSDPKKPSWFYVGAYKATATFQGITSQPLYIPVASSGGVQTVGNPNGVCDQPTS